MSKKSRGIGGPEGPRVIENRNGVETVSFQDTADSAAEMDLYSKRRFQLLVQEQEGFTIPLDLIQVTNIDASPEQIELMRRSNFLPAAYAEETGIQLPLTFAVLSDAIYINGRTWRRLNEVQRETSIWNHIMPVVRERLGTPESYPAPVFVFGEEVR